MPSVLPPRRSGPLRHDRRRNAAPRTKLPFHFRPHRFRPLHHILQNLVDHILLKNPQIPVALQIFLQRFQLQATFVRHIANRQHSKIRQPGLRTHRRKFRIIHHNLITRKLVRPGLNLRKLRVQTSSCVLRRITRRFTHETIVAFDRNASRVARPASNQYLASRVSVYVSRLAQW